MTRKIALADDIRERQRLEEWTSGIRSADRSSLLQLVEIDETNAPSESPFCGSVLREVLEGVRGHTAKKRTT